MAGVTDRCDWPKEAASRARVVRALSEPNLAATEQQRRGSRDRRRSTSSSDDGAGPGGPSLDPPSIAVDCEALAREAPCLVVAPDLACTGAADARVLTEVRLLPTFW